MAVFKCKMCGGSLEVSSGASVATCPYCDSQQTLPNLNDDKIERLYDRASHFRRNNEFDKAIAIYEEILNEDTRDAEAYWSLVLCRYGIEYVKDSDGRYLPTCHRTLEGSILDDGERYIPGMENEQVLLQGVVDCAIIEPDGITVIDFKTNRVTEDTVLQVAQQYRTQVLVYADALERIYQKPVKSAQLYFFRLNRFVSMK